MSVLKRFSFPNHCQYLKVCSCWKYLLWNPGDIFKTILFSLQISFIFKDILLICLLDANIWIYSITSLTWISYCPKDLYFRNQVKLVPWNAQKCMQKQKWMNTFPNDYVNLQFSVTQAFMITIFNTVLSLLFIFSLLHFTKSQ